MDESYKQMMELYADQQKELSKRPNWIGSKVKGAMEPSDMTVTHVNQTRDLLVRFWKPEPMFHNSLNRYIFILDYFKRGFASKWTFNTTRV